MDRRPLGDKERSDWLRLTRTKNVGAITFRHLLQRYGSAAEALGALPDFAARSSKRAFKLPNAVTVDEEIKGCERLGIRLIANCEPDYPEALAAIEDAPPVIAAKIRTSPIT